MQWLEEDTIETMMEKVDKFKTGIAQIEPPAGPPGPMGPRGFNGQNGSPGPRGRYRPVPLACLRAALPELLCDLACTPHRGA
jgi:hypothetical protein